MWAVGAGTVQRHEPAEMILAETTEARAWIDGYLAQCDMVLWRGKCEHRAVTVQEYGNSERRMRVTRCADHVGLCLPIASGDLPIESVRQPLAR